MIIQGIYSRLLDKYENAPPVKDMIIQGIYSHGNKDDA